VKAYYEGRLVGSVMLVISECNCFIALIAFSKTEGSFFILPVCGLKLYVYPLLLSLHKHVQSKLWCLCRMIRFECFFGFSSICNATMQIMKVAFWLHSLFSIPLGLQCNRKVGSKIGAETHFMGSYLKRIVFCFPMFEGSNLKLCLGCSLMIVLTQSNALKSGTAGGE
jgi:hypothetical protein